MKVSGIGFSVIMLLFSAGCKKSDGNPAAASPDASAANGDAPITQIPADSTVGRIKPTLASSADAECPAFLALQLTGDSVNIEVKGLGGKYFADNGFSGSTRFTCQVLLKTTVPGLQSMAGTFGKNQSIRIASQFGAAYAARFVLQAMFTEFDSTRTMAQTQGQIADLQGPLATTADYSFQPLEQNLISRCSAAEQSIGIVFWAEFTLMRTDSREISEASVDGKLPRLDLNLKPCSL